MAHLTVRDAPDDVVAVLRQEAADRHTSLNSILCTALAEHAARIRRRGALLQALPRFDALQSAILASRDGRPTADAASLLRGTATAEAGPCNSSSTRRAPSPG